MKKLTTFIFILLCVSSFSRDIQTIDGKTYRNATVVDKNPTGINVKYIYLVDDRGRYTYKTAFLKFKDLPKAIQKEFNYDPEKAEKYKRYSKYENFLPKVDLETSDGKKYKDAVILKKTILNLYIKHDGNKIKLPLEDLTKELKIKYGYDPEKAKRYKEYLKKKRLARIEREILRKERLAEKQKREEEERKVKKYYSGLRQITENDSLRKIPFKVIQSLSDGSLCVLGRVEQYKIGRDWQKRTTYDGAIIKIIDTSQNTVVDGDKYVQDILFYAGNHQYTTVEGISKTIRAYAIKEQNAINRLQSIFPPPWESIDTAKSKPKDDKQGNCPTGTVLSGTGFFISDNGYIITNAHVIRGCNVVKIWTSSGSFSATICKKDIDTDLALLKVKGNFAPLPIAPEPTAKLGETVFTVGFPLPDIQGFSPKISKGIISSLKGYKDEICRYQISAPIHPGNSGGALLDEKGNIVGVIVSGLNDMAVFEKTKVIPENVGYAIKKAYIPEFISKWIKKENMPKPSTEKLPFEKAVEKAQAATVMIEAHYDPNASI